MSETSPQPIFLLYGENSFSSTEKLNFYKDGFIKKYGEESDIQILNGKKLDVGQFITNLEAIPFLAEKRLIIIKNFLQNGNKDDQKKVAENIQRAPDFCIVIFHEDGIPDRSRVLYKRIKKHGQVQEFPPPTPVQLNNWIRDKAQKLDLKINMPEITHLTNHAGNDLWKLSSELSKLKTFAQDKAITKEMIEELTTPSLSASIFKLTDKISEKQSKEALRIFQILADSGEDPIRVFFMIVRHFRILIQVNELVAKNESPTSITKKLKQHPFVIQKTSSQSRNFETEKLEEIYKSLLKIDRDFKTGVIKTYQSDNREYFLAIEKLIINCCH